MARVTVEDCLEKVDNHFQLVLLAAKRARQLDNGEEPLVDFDGDKSTVVALREIAQGLITPALLDETEAQLTNDIEPEEAASDEVVGTAKEAADTKGAES